MTKAREFLTAGLVAAMFAGGVSVATPASAGGWDYGGWRGYPGGGFDGYDFNVAMLGAAVGASSLIAISAGPPPPRAHTCFVPGWDPLQGYVEVRVRCY